MISSDASMVFDSFHLSMIAMTLMLIVEAQIKETPYCSYCNPRFTLAFS